MSSKDRAGEGADNGNTGKFGDGFLTPHHEIIDQVNRSLSVLAELDNQPAYTDFSPTNYNTRFRYRLDDKGVELAKKGLADLHIASPYTLLFAPFFNQVELGHDGISYRIDKGWTSGYIPS